VLVREGAEFVVLSVPAPAPFPLVLEDEGIFVGHRRSMVENQRFLGLLWPS